ncbi:MAG: EthD domain-containing protein [Myxococcota bacterium]|nr:EthD domain-containing protein [Myxococcota bacterium]
MEKLVYLISKDQGVSGDALREDLMKRVVPVLRDSGGQNVSLNVADDAVKAGEGVRISTSEPPIRAMVSFWLENADDRQSAEDALGAESEMLAGYLVAESRPMVYDPSPGERSRGANLVTRIHKKSDISDEEFIERWTVEHRQVAVETQSTFAYVRNAVLRTLVPGTPDCDGIVEESFPMEALSNPHVWYDCDNEAEYRRRLERMMDSVNAFLDLGRLESIPMSEYRLG